MNETVTIPLSISLAREARTLGADVAQACEKRVAAAVAEARAAAWLRENREGIEAWNEHVARHGVPLAGFRRF